MFLPASSHMPIFSFILVDDDFMIQGCKNNTSLALEHSAISKRVLVITHAHISRLFTLWDGYVNISLFFLHGKNYILHPPTGAGIRHLRLRFENCMAISPAGLTTAVQIRASEKGDRKAAVIVDNFIFFGQRKTESKKHLVNPSITGAYSKTC